MPQIAGFNVLRILNEPTAAAIAYGLEQTDVRGTSSQKEQLILVLYVWVDSELCIIDLIFMFAAIMEAVLWTFLFWPSTEVSLK